MKPPRFSRPLGRIFVEVGRVEVSQHTWDDANEKSRIMIVRGGEKAQTRMYVKDKLQLTKTKFWLITTALPCVGIFLLLWWNVFRACVDDVDELIPLVGRWFVLVAFLTGRWVVIFVKAYGVVDRLSIMRESIIRAIWLNPFAGGALKKVMDLGVAFKRFWHFSSNRAKNVQSFVSF